MNKDEKNKRLLEIIGMKMDYYLPNADPRPLIEWCEEENIEVTACYYPDVKEWHFTLENLEGKIAVGMSVLEAKEFFTTALADAILKWGEQC